MCHTRYANSLQLNISAVLAQAAAADDATFSIGSTESDFGESLSASPPPASQWQLPSPRPELQRQASAASAQQQEAQQPLSLQE